jgi:hypothetical protein
MTHLGFVENTSWPLVKSYFSCSLYTCSKVANL